MDKKKPQPVKAIPLSDTLPVPIDYSSISEERKREQESTDEWRKGVENYNEATCGERRPISNAFYRRALLIAVLGLMALILPRRMEWMVIVVGLAFAIWENMRYGS